MALLIVETHAGTRTIERAPCCGGLFLESGDAMALIGRGPEGPSARVEGPVGKTCPLCHSGLSPTVLHEFEVDECAACDHIFFDGGEAEKAGIDTQALFGDGPGSAQATGAGGACPSCDTPMHRYRAEMAMGPAVEASFAACCGGVWVARGLEPRLRSAARCAVSKRADQQFMSGQPVQATAATRTPEELRASQVAMERYQSVVEKQRVLAARDARRARQGGILENLGFDFDGDSSCGSDCD